MDQILKNETQRNPKRRTRTQTLFGDAQLKFFQLAGTVRCDFQYFALLNLHESSNWNFKIYVPFLGFPQAKA